MHKQTARRSDGYTGTVPRDIGCIELLYILLRFAASCITCGVTNGIKFGCGWLANSAQTKYKYLVARLQLFMYDEFILPAGLINNYLRRILWKCADAIMVLTTLATVWVLMFMLFAVMLYVLTPGCVLAFGGLIIIAIINEIVK